MLQKIKHFKPRTWLTIGTLVLLVLVVFFGRSEIVRAFGLLGKVDLRILALLIPVQLLSYYAVGGTIFSYLRAKGNLQSTGRWAIARMALELNFVNHILPSGGAAGFSYLAWVLNRYGVSPGRATLAQLIRFALTFITFIGLLIVSVIFVALDTGVSRFILLLSSGLVATVVFGLLFLTYVIGSESRMQGFARWLTLAVNKLVRKVTFGRIPKVLKIAVLEKFFQELHNDFRELKSEKRILVRPVIWALVANIADVALLWITFASFGAYINPAVLLIGFGVSGALAAISITPGGTGVYEAVMILFLGSAGVSPDIAIAGTLLTRVILLIGTIGFGYVFYQLTIIKYGKKASDFVHARK
jgi:uncharacterized protein (TIRG00374 family)